MIRIIAALTVVLFASNAHAFGNTTTNNNPTQGQAQGQMQGQIGINKSSVKNTTVGKNTLSNKSSNISSNKNKASARQNQDASSSNNIVFKGAEAPYIPVNTAYAPYMGSTSDCLGSVSAGGQGQFFGGSLGFTTKSKPCNVREFAKMVSYDKELYIAILCQDKSVKKAMESTGRLCPNSNAKKVAKANSKRARYIKDNCAYPTEQCKRLRR